MPVIGLLDPRSPDAMADRLRAFRLGLKDAGYVEGENVTIIYRFRGAVEQVRSGHQRRDCPNARPRSAADAARPRRRGDRMNGREFIVRFC
jgi:hypothetical protein